MKLFYSTTSPFARKILIALKLLNLEEQCELILANPFDNPQALLNANPLSKIPALLLDENSALSDSNLIFQYLDSISEQTSLYPSEEDHWEKLQFTQLAEGILTAAVAIVMERKRPANFQYPAFIDRQYDSIARSLSVLESSIALASQDTPSLLEITLGTALDYLDFRLPDIQWRSKHPSFEAWHSEYSKRPEMQATLPVAQT